MFFPLMVVPCCCFILSDLRISIIAACIIQTPTRPDDDQGGGIPDGIVISVCVFLAVGDSYFDNPLKMCWKTRERSLTGLEWISLRSHGN